MGVSHGQVIGLAATDVMGRSQQWWVVTGVRRSIKLAGDTLSLLFAGEIVLRDRPASGRCHDRA